jgi:ABC-type multidrug transport system ATPase subunit
MGDDGVVVPTGIAIQVGLPTLNSSSTQSPVKSSTNFAGKPLRMTTNPCTLSWSSLCYTVDTKKKTPKHPDGKKAILTNVTGRCAPGELTAVMGPSGSGKTTLLDILADRISSGSIKGDIALNGETRNIKTFRAVSSYVAQEDSLLGSFTVLETLEMAAKLSLPSSVSHHEVVERVQTVIDEMGLRVCEHAHVGDMFRKGISGGQKRRLSIAIELLSEPSILLLDEPTSGLDSASTYNVMKFVSRLCKENMTVVCTIHQPSSLVYNMFTNVVILTAGQTVFFGPRVDMMPHFASLGYACPEHEDPAEHFISIANTDFDGHGDIPVLVSGYAASAVAARLQEAIQADAVGLHAMRAFERVPSSPVRQLLVLLQRNLLDNLRNPGIFWVRLIMYTVLSFMMGTMFLSTNTGLVAHDIVYLLTYANCFLVFMSIAVLPFFIEQRAVFLRERTNSNLNVFSYVIANFLGALPGIFLIALSSTLLVGYLADLNSYGIFLLTVFLSLMVAESLMHLVAACVPHFIIGMALGAAVFGWFILCMGLFVPRPAIPGYWIWAHYLGFLSYGFEALMHNQFHTDDSPAAKLILSRFGMEDVDLGRDLAILAANAVAFEIIFTCVLYKFHTGRR